MQGNLHTNNECSIVMLEREDKDEIQAEFPKGGLEMVEKIIKLFLDGLKTLKKIIKVFFIFGAIQFLIGAIIATAYLTFWHFNSAPRKYVDYQETFEQNHNYYNLIVKMVQNGELGVIEAESSEEFDKMLQEGKLVKKEFMYALPKNLQNLSNDGSINVQFDKDQRIEKLTIILAKLNGQNFQHELWFRYYENEEDLKKETKEMKEKSPESRVNYYVVYEFDNHWIYVDWY